MSLDEIRHHIDGVDAQMKKLFLERMDCARQVAEEKAKTGGDVFVPSREEAILAARTEDVDPACQAEYAWFLRLLMSISRRYQYGLLPEMQKSVLEAVSGQAGLDPTAPHTQVRISFACRPQEPKLALLANMAALNGVTVTGLNLTTGEDGTQQVTAALAGHMGQDNMRRLLCQLGKELDDFSVIGLD